MESLKAQLGMSVLPRHIECFDNSNLQGTNAVSACVVFRDGVPCKKDYRHFKVKTVVGANDYATMKEVVNRRYSRMLQENPEDLPQLIVIDGGKGQLAVAYEALSELGIIDKVKLVALAERLEEIYRVGDPNPLFLDRNSPALKVLQHIRDEAHRFGITFHRNLRSKAQIQSVLRSIKGVGEKTEGRLLMRFHSVARLAEAPVDEIAKLVGKKLAQTIHDELNKKNED
jgi:excinuclease ABC subunit C